MVNSPFRRPYLLGGGSFGGGTLDSHDHRIFQLMLKGSRRQRGKGEFTPCVECFFSGAVQPSRLIPYP